MLGGPFWGGGGVQSFHDSCQLWGSRKQDVMHVLLYKSIRKSTGKLWQLAQLAPCAYNVRFGLLFLHMSIWPVMMEALFFTVATATVSVCGLSFDGGGDATAPRSFSCGQSKATCPGWPHVQHTRRSPACGIRGLGKSRCRWPTPRQLKHRLGVRLPRLVWFLDMVRTVTCSFSSEICFLSS